MFCEWTEAVRRIVDLGGKVMLGFYNYTVVLTYAGLACSVFGMMQALNQNYKLAVLFLVLSGACDMFDGKVARSKTDRTEEEKRFGIQIDSLCDLVCFGVFPAVIGYSLGVKGNVERLCLVFYVLAAVIRLAYFNVTEETRQKQTNEVRKYYQGLPVTSAAAIFPLIFLLRGGLLDCEQFRVTYLAAIILVGILFISNIKVIKPGNKAVIVFIILGALLILKMLAG